MSTETAVYNGVYKYMCKVGGGGVNLIKRVMQLQGEGYKISSRVTGNTTINPVL